jgi:MoaA/NifB/PqqE/SkfB family radical SAM enzyme
MNPLDGPRDVIWDITYACPLRCVHCYSESGRRPSRQLSLDDMLRVADALVSLEPQAVVLAGGEPLVIKGVFDVAERLAQAGVQVYLYTGGWSLQPWMVERMVSTIAQVSVSIDGATAEVHDAIRGRAGSFDRAMQALAMLDDAARELRERGAKPLAFGMDCTLTRSSFPQIDEFCTTIAPRFPELGFISIGAAMPIGLASRTGFVDRELLTDAQADQLASAEQLDRLRVLAPPSVQVSVTDNRMLQMHPDLIARGVFPTMQLEPDGAVRAMAIYEGTVGNVLIEDPRVLWERAVARWSDPVVTETLGPARTMREWAEATRQIDYHFGSDSDRARIDRRPAYPALAP